MYVAHNAINQEAEQVKQPAKVKPSTWAQKASYKAYQKSLKKYEAEIAEIQKSWPGWLPKQYQG